MQVPMAILRNVLLILLILLLRAKGTSERYSRLSLCADVLLYLLPGFLVFIFLPAGCLVVLEGWSFIEAVYFGFITLTTIGLGDLVAGSRFQQFKQSLESS